MMENTKTSMSSSESDVGDEDKFVSLETSRNLKFEK